MQALNEFVSSSKREAFLEAERERALNAFLKANKVDSLEYLINIGQAGQIETDYTVDWSTLAFKPEQLSNRIAIPIGSIYDQRKELHIVHIYAVPPSRTDNNTYSLHCEPGYESQSLLQGPVQVSSLLMLNWIVGMGNGVKGFNLGSTDQCWGLHWSIVNRLNSIRAVLNQ